MDIQSGLLGTTLQFQAGKTHDALALIQGYEGVATGIETRPMQNLTELCYACALVQQISGVGSVCEVDYDVQIIVAVVTNGDGHPKAPGRLRSVSRRGFPERKARW